MDTINCISSLKKLILPYPTDYQLPKKTKRLFPVFLSITIKQITKIKIGRN